jgi:type III restriction enzyme
MAMLIAWQVANAVRRDVKWATRGFLVVAPGLTIKDRLRVLEPNHPESYFATRDLVPAGLRQEVDKAVVVITNYHAFMLRKNVDVENGTRRLIEGRRGEPMQTTETEGDMLRRVMSPLMGIKNVAVINDEAHHCYREKPAPEGEKLTGDDKKEADKNNEHARVWISGLEAVQRTMGISRVYDLSATPFFLSGSGYAEGTLFPWTVSDFSLLDAIECGIVKLPRVPVAENIAGDDLPMYRDLWSHVRNGMPKKKRSEAGPLDPLKLPTPLQTALQALYGHYEKTFKLWQQRNIPVPPCFIVVCQNTAISKLVYDYISGFRRTDADGKETLENGRLPLFRNYDEVTCNPLPRPNTILVDSEQMESEDGLDDSFRGIAGDEIERFRRELIERGQHDKARTLSDGDLSVALAEADGDDKAFDLLVRRGGDQELTPVKMLSGSQKFRVAVSVALAIGRFATGQARPLECVIIDEGFGSLDRDGLRAAADELNRLKDIGELKRVIVVSHQEEFTDQFPVVIRLSKGEHGTTAEAVRQRR